MNSDIRDLRMNSRLPQEAYEQIDETVTTIADSRLTVSTDMAVFPLDNVGVKEIGWDDLNDVSAAEVSMGGTDESMDEVGYSRSTANVPVLHKEFEIDWRSAAASGQFETDNVARTSRAVAEAIESLVLDGDATLGIDGLNDAATNSVTGSDWGTIGNIYTDVIDAIAAEEADSIFGPYNLYVAATQFAEMRDVYSDGSGQTALQRVQNIPEIASVKPADQLSAGNAVLVANTTNEWMDMPVAQGLTSAPIEENNFVSKQRVFQVSSVRIRNGDAICQITGI